jgi:transketolase
MDYDTALPDRHDADVISYAAGHKALGLYALWALRNEIVRIGAPDLLAADEHLQLRLEDLLGFRKNPVAMTVLQKKLRVKALDGHPTPATPFRPALHRSIRRRPGRLHRACNRGARPLRP